jgi:hypothetical protein
LWDKFNQALIRNIIMLLSSAKAAALADPPPEDKVRLPSDDHRFNQLAKLMGMADNSNHGPGQTFATIRRTRAQERETVITMKFASGAAAVAMLTEAAPGYLSLYRQPVRGGPDFSMQSFAFGAYGSCSRNKQMESDVRAASPQLCATLKARRKKLSAFVSGVFPR